MFGEPCNDCDDRPASHHVGDRWQCCECYVSDGYAPADWHPACMKAYAERSDAASDTEGKK